MKQVGCALSPSGSCRRFPCPEAIHLILHIKYAVNVTVNVYGIDYSKYTDGIGRCQVQIEGILRCYKYVISLLTYCCHTCLLYSTQQMENSKRRENNFGGTLP